jgi:hypothetical protein
MHIGFHFVVLILNKTMVQRESKIDSRFKRKMHSKVANQLNLHPLDQPYRDICHPTVEAFSLHSFPSCANKFHSKPIFRRYIGFWVRAPNLVEHK